ncbi:MAG TPA: glycosyltransferase family 4 protein [Candidatus Saccharimonadia bacterium]|nr:glycosyltransferase family 4 protein [Candidatus Saccharimonadia bacterium]
MKIAYVCHHGRPIYGHEQAWFAAMPVDAVRLITTQAPPSDTGDGKVEYCQVPYRVAKGRLFSDSTALRVNYYDFERLLDDIDVVVVLEVFSSLSRQFVAYCNKIGKPVAVLVYELIENHPIYYIPGYRANAHFVLRHADAFIAVSHAAAKHLDKLGAPKNKVRVLYPGVDVKKFSPDRSHRGDRSIIFVGPKLGPHKGVDLVIDTYRRIVRDIPDLNLTIVGEGGLEDEVKQLVTDYPGVEYLKPVPNSEIPALLNRHAVFILPARDNKRFGIRIGAEQFGFSVVEAMACGLAIVTSNTGALAEIVTSKNIICPQGDADSLYRQTAQLLDDPKRIHEIGNYNYHLAAERYNISDQGAALAQALAELIPAAKPKGTR